MTVAYSTAETMHPDIAEISHRASEDPKVARSLLGLADLPTIVATGPFDDLTHAHQLAAAFTILQRACRAQLVLLGTGAHRTAALRAVPRGAGTRVHLLDASSMPLWSDIISAADLVVLSTTSGPRRLLDVLAAGRAVVAPMDPATVRLVVPTSAGLVYRPGDVSALASAIKRLMTTPRLRQGIASRAREVARRHQLERVTRQGHEKGNGHDEIARAASAANRGIARPKPADSARRRCINAHAAGKTPSLHHRKGTTMTDIQPTPTTTDAGIPVESDEHSLTIGPDGPILLHDHY